MISKVRAIERGSTEDHREKTMLSKEIFIKKMARKVEDDELDEVAGGFVGTCKTCHISGMDDCDPDQPRAN